MLFYLLSADELRAVLQRLGYRLTRDTIRKTIEYYLARTSHGSTLSALVHAWVLGRANRDNALEHFTRLLRSDTADIQGGTTAEGVHLAAMAGSVDVLQRCAEPGKAPPIRVQCWGQTIMLGPGDSAEFVVGPKVVAR